MKPYSIMYRHWIGTPGIGAADIAVLSGLYARADIEGVCADLVQDELARELGKSRPWLSAVLTRLQTPGLALVEARRKRGFRGMVYALSGAAADSSRQGADATGQPADGLLESGNPFSSDSQNSSSHRAGRAGGKGRGDDQPSSSALSQDWQPTAEDIAWAGENRPEVDPAAVSRKFVAWCRKANVRNGYRPADPSAAWRKWVARELVAPAEPASMTPPAQPSPSAATAATAAFPPHAARRPTNRSDQNDRRPHDPVPQPGSRLAARNAGVLAALRDRLARTA